MSRIAYVNGVYVPQHLAKVNIEDRGYQFADGIYEVIAVTGGELIDGERHFNRLERSLSELRIAAPCSRAVLKIIAYEVLRRNHIENGIVYLQITRGVAPRNHSFPRPGTERSALVMTASRKFAPDKSLTDQGVKAITLLDERWKRPDIKSVSLLPNVLGKQKAVEAGAYEAFFVDQDGFITEGSSTNIWIVSKDGEVLTRPLDNAILAGITRHAVMDTARSSNYKVVEQPFTVDQARSAAEVFITSTTSFVLPVIAIDDKVVGDGRPGPVTKALLDRYGDHVRGHAPAGGNRR